MSLKLNNLSAKASQPATNAAAAEGKNTLEAKEEKFTKALNAPNKEKKGTGNQDSEISFGSLFSKPFDTQKNDSSKNKKSTKPPVEQILNDYQVADDIMIKNWRPKLPGTSVALPFSDPEKQLTRTEANLLEKLGTEYGLAGLKVFKNVREDARETAERFFPTFNEKTGEFKKGAEDGHNDAFRHAYWSASLSRRFGESFSKAYTTAHEAVPGNNADKEAMDLYNNDLGRRIARENPGVSDEKLAQLVADAVNKGDAVVIYPIGGLAYSDKVPVGLTGDANRPPKPGVIKQPEWEPGIRNGGN